MAIGFASISEAFNPMTKACNDRQVHFVFGEHADTCSIMRFDRFLASPDGHGPGQKLRSAANEFLMMNQAEIRLIKSELKHIRGRLATGEVNWLGLEENPAELEDLGLDLPTRLKKMDLFHANLRASGLDDLQSRNVLLLHFGASSYVIWDDQTGKLKTHIKALVALDDEEGGAVTEQDLCGQAKPSRADEEAAMQKRNRVLISGIGRASRKFGNGLVTFGEYHEEIFLSKKTVYQNDFKLACLTPEANRIKDTKPSKNQR